MVLTRLSGKGDYMQKIDKSMSGGKKSMYLRNNRPEIMAFFEAHGERATRERYNIKKDDTWRRLLNPATNQPNPRLTKADKAALRAEIAEEGLREVKREVKDLREQYAQFVPLVADELTNKFFKPLLSGKVELPPDMIEKPKASPLRLSRTVRITPRRPRIR